MKIETKFNIGDCVYRFSEGAVIKSEVTKVLIQAHGNWVSTEYKLKKSHGYHHQISLFASKADLIKHIESL